MSVWLCIPSVRPPEEAEKCLKLWRERGYKIALWRDDLSDSDFYNRQCADWLYEGVYPGYSAAVNFLILAVMERDPQAEWFVIGGDDVSPDPNHIAEEIARQTREYFVEDAHLRRGVPNPMHTDLYRQASTFGVMQPTGDRFADGSIDKIAGSAWIGREFARRMYQGKGPLWPEYTRFYMDEELQEVATRWGVFHQRRDLVHLHRHYMRESDAIDSPAIYSEIPEHLKAQEVKWKAEQDIFNKRKHARPTPWPGSEPIAWAGFIVHVAGEMFGAVQRCVRCKEVLTDYTNCMTTSSRPLSGFAAGAYVAVAYPGGRQKIVVSEPGPGMVLCNDGAGRSTAIQ